MRGSLRVITIILGASIFVDVTSRSGLFTWIAIRLTKTSRGDPLILLIFYGLMTVVFSAWPGGRGQLPTRGSQLR